MNNRTKVLVVDDDKDMGWCISEALTHLGFDVETVTSSYDACEALDQKKFDVVVSDINMPEVNGLEFSKLLMEAKHQLPRIAMTGNGAMLESDFKEAGFQGFLFKPFGPNELLAAIQKVVELN